MNDREKIERMGELVGEAIQLGKPIGEFLFENGVEPRERAKWMRDNSYKGSSKDIFICSGCLRWQSVKKLKPDQMMYMKYCPFCGARMEV